MAMLRVLSTLLFVALAFLGQHPLGAYAATSNSTTTTRSPMAANTTTPDKCLRISRRLAHKWGYWA
eukprot:CAMPEP_0170414230 /NCGR_PEP_ID=MMETSP0117_2-20130122/31953_1 /TAXON_ID=400756 /ORGANISM="Durinskia baltica, Strain CSIRO CS-38" /LENGTH=65 /DNA_ID=CAMNT_0010672097 /DNA_START=41 /DNA_END=234 /DNA_ORIENTATION=-